MNYFKFTTDLENTFSIEEHANGFLYECQNRWNAEKAVHDETQNVYFSLKYPTLKGEHISIIKNTLTMPVDNGQNDCFALVRFDPKHIASIRKTDINEFKVIHYTSDHREKEIESKIIRLGTCSAHYNFHAFKFIYHLFLLPQITIEEAETFIDENKIYP
jgi:hypothetical protein